MNEFKKADALGEKLPEQIGKGINEEHKEKVLDYRKAEAEKELIEILRKRLKVADERIEILKEHLNIKDQIIKFLKTK